MGRYSPSNIRNHIRARAEKILLGRGRPDMSGFVKELTPALVSERPGRFASLFFGHEGRRADKWLHYLPIYDQLLGPLAGSKVRMLEIGVFRGGSLDLWRKFLGPDATIFGIDIHPGCAEFDGEAARVRIGSQDDPAFLRRVVAEMGGVDVVLDDGSHVASHQRVSFEVLFPLLSNGGLYVIEDTHTSYWSVYYQGGLRRKGTAIEFMKNKIDAMHRHYFERDTNRADLIPEIESIQFFDSIIAVRKRTQLPRVAVTVPLDTSNATEVPRLIVPEAGGSAPKASRRR